MGKRIASLLLCLPILLLAGCGLGTDASTAPSPTSSTTPASPPPTTQQNLSQYEGLNDEEKLIAVGTWEKERHPANTMIFKEGGTGLITNYGITYNMTWSIEGNALSTKVELIKGEEMQSVVYGFRMESNAYVITNQDKKSEARFYIGGTQPTELPAGGKKDQGVLGKWVLEGSTSSDSVFGYNFADDTGVSGKFRTNDQEQAIISEFRWTVSNYRIYIYFVNGPQYVYEYMLSGDTLIFYQEGQSNIVYKRIT